MAETRREGPSQVLYVYDRICPKVSKQREILREYGSGPKKSAPRSNAPGGRSQSGNGPRGAMPNRPVNKQGQTGRRPGQPGQSGQQRPKGGPGQSYGGRPRTGGQAYGNGPRVYSSTANNRGRNDQRNGYRSGGSYAHAGGYYGAAVKQKPLKLLLDGIINFIDSVEERGRNDERIAKRRAIAAKRWSECKHIVKTVLILLLILATFITLVYKLFFVVKEINVDGSSIYGTDQVVGASGIALGDTIYSFSAGNVGDAITFHCPYIQSVDVDRTLPNKVSITLTDDTAVYYANVWGDWLKLSAGLRVLEVTTEAEAEAAGLARLILPAIDYSVAGGVIEFTDAKNERFIRDSLAAVGGSQLGRTGFIDWIDLSRQYDIQIEYDGKYLLKFGSEAELKTKLLMAYKTITSEGFEKGTPARMDLSVVGEASVLYDHSIGKN